MGRVDHKRLHGSRTLRPTRRRGYGNLGELVGPTGASAHFLLCRARQERGPRRSVSRPRFGCACISCVVCGWIRRESSSYFWSLVSCKLGAESHCLRPSIHAGGEILVWGKPNGGRCSSPLTIGSSDRGVASSLSHGGVDDWDKSVSFGLGSTPRRSTSSLDAWINLGTSRWAALFGGLPGSSGPRSWQLVRLYWLYTALCMPAKLICMRCSSDPRRYRC
jgi:hypothetical protein